MKVPSTFRELFAAVLLLPLSLACGSAGVRPVAYPDPEVACPGGRQAWKLEIADRRAQRRDSERIIGLLRESLTRSFPGCRWESATGSEAPAILIEVHRFAVSREDSSWEAAAEWTVLARDGNGRTLTEFESRAEVSRPDYRGANNELEAMKQAFDEALRRTLAGLRAVSVARNRPLEGTANGVSLL